MGSDSVMDEGISQQMPITFGAMLGTGDAVSMSGGGCSGFGGAFDIDGDKVVNCGLAFGRTWVECEDTKLDVLDGKHAPEGVIYASVAHRAGGELKLSVKHAADLPENGLDVSNRALYKARGQGAAAQWIDLRSGITIYGLD